MYNPYGYCPYMHNPYNSMTNSNSYVRVFHASPDAPPVDVYVNNKIVASNLMYQNFTEFLPLSPGRYNLKVFAAGTTTNPVIDTVVNIPQGSIFTAAAVGRLNDIELQLIEEPRMSIPPGRVYVRFGHLSPNAPRVDVRLADGTPLFTNVGFTEISRYIPVSPGAYTLNVFIAGTNERVLTVPNINLQANRFYTVYAVGLAGQRPPLQVVIPLDGNSYLSV